MAMYTLDTHATIRDLEAAGIETAHAEAIVSAISRADGNLATKSDIIGLRWIVGIQSAFILAITLRVFGIV